MTTTVSVAAVVDSVSVTITVPRTVAYWVEVTIAVSVTMLAGADTVSTRAAAQSSIPCSFWTMAVEICQYSPCQSSFPRVDIPFKHLLLRQQAAEARLSQAKPEARNRACFIMKTIVWSC